jgi:preprotein translocase subunit SecY
MEVSAPRFLHPDVREILNIFRIPDLRKRVLFTLACWPSTASARTFPRPASTPSCSAQFFNQQLRLGARPGRPVLRRQPAQAHVFALGIMPYITASIIFQLLTVIYEPLAKLQKEGELGRRKITQWTRYVTVLLGIVQSSPSRSR